MIIIDRESAYADKLRNYDIEVDGAIVGTIGDGETKRLAVEPGEHTLCLRIAWTRSKIVHFEVKTGQTIHFRSASNLKGAKLWLAVFYAILLPHRYIRLEKVS